MMIDTHCHIHEAEFFETYKLREEVYRGAIDAGVGMICVATSQLASEEAIEFVRDHENTWAVLGVHPHETIGGWNRIGEFLLEKHEKVVGIGEIGLDYFYMNTPRDTQIAALEEQLQWARDYNLPVSFHVRDRKNPNEGSVWNDFWPIVDNFSQIRGVLHSFTDTWQQCEYGLGRGFYIGINGISTFTKDAAQIDIYDRIPLENIVLETDSPFLTPAPFRGKMNQPMYVERVAEHLAAQRNASLVDVSAITTTNAKRLFTI